LTKGAGVIKNKKSGLTIIELVMVIAIVGIVAGLSSVYINEVIDTYRLVSFRMESVAQMRGAIDRMSREIRQIKNSTSVLAASANLFRFNCVDNTTISYNLSGTNLLRNNSMLASGIGRLNFTYYNNTGGIVAAPDVYPDVTDIVRIKIELEARSAAQNKNLSVQVFPRNLGG
jgi:prepilin-type N-terminal cleavage/methylation domain-containing protein